MAAARAARIELTGESRSLTAALRRASSQVHSFAAQSSRVVGRYGAASAVVLGQAVGRGGVAVARGAYRAGRAAAPALGQGLAAGAGVAGVALAATAVDVRDFEETLTRLGMAGDLSATEVGGLRNAIRAVSKETGIDANDILGGAQAYVGLTGDIKGAAASARLFAEVTQASGAKMEDVAAVGAALSDALNIKPGAEMEAAFSSLIVQGKAGAVELRDLAGELSSLAPLMSKFGGGTGLDGIRELGAGLQVARKGFGSASEAATGMQALIVSLTKNASKFGVKNIFEVGPNGEKRLRNFSDIITAISESRIAKDPTRLAKAFGSVEALRTFNELRRNAALYDELIEKGQDVGAVQRDLNTYLSSDAGRMSKSVNNMKETLAEVFTPERIERAANALDTAAKLVEYGVDSVETVAHGVRVATGNDSEYEENVKYNRKRQQRVSYLQWRMGYSEERASQQVAQEDVARTRLRTGAEDYQGTFLLQAQRERIASGTWSNKAELLTAIDNAIARVNQKEMAAAVEQGVRRALEGGGLNPVLKIGHDAIRGAVQNAPGIRRRPGG